MLQERLTLANLPKLDFGKIDAVFANELERLVRDCEQRPMDDKPRVLNVAFRLVPNIDKNGIAPTCDTIDVEVEINGKVPVNRTKVYAMKPKHDGSLVFHPDSPEDPDADLLYDNASKRRESQAS